ncbi:TM2 domain-containing protein [Sediminispirochaeta smaragdinae]|uniref:TM2 domain containing protein n=1 Tax=Sediminispirochaeta smaragdinae (strain DSM 11293 / JCM 15392 / SEBR 4228) TaxID=573413 RepID=E1R5B7_SEDSS|nr:TM2 domain-containing protein [Sediminispirochaeta smaragdinae]ADK82245.1 TM2 domain containing protein [Sediminispirochaeta smaragdinae DSM 11293]
MYSTGIAYLLWLISGFGALGFHRFYLGKPGSGLLYLFTGGLFGIGAFYDLITLPMQVREANLRVGYHNAFLGAMAGGAHGPIDRTHTGGARSLGRKESLEQAILKTAKKNKGVVTPSSVALECDKGLDDVKKALELLVEKGYADLRVTKNGALVYFFQEFSEGGSHPDLEEM